MLKRLWAHLVIAIDYPDDPGTRCAESLYHYRCMRSAYPHRIHYHVDGAKYLRWNFGGL